MQVITFYSYKGGVGRTLACANFGLYLAKTGQKVVLADMDFEAPGLDSKFPSIKPADLATGLLEQFSAFQEGREIPDLTAVEIELPSEIAQAGGLLQVIPAGDYLSPDYYTKLSGLRWESLLGDETGLAFCIDLVKRIEEKFGADVLVIDSRTGLTEVGGLCTQVLPDTVIMLTNTSRESLRGTQRIYDRIQNSPIVKSRAGGRTEVETRVVLTRIPRPEDLPEFDRLMKKRLDIPVERLYYLFDQHDLSLDEYLAMDRFDEHPKILDDYVELFASFNPEITLPYVEERLALFRSQLTRRTVQENERIIQELVTLFPHPDVMLEAARYYRLVKDGDAKAVGNYIRYLDSNRDNIEALSEFADLCLNVPVEYLEPKNKIVFHLRSFGVDRLVPRLLSLYVKWCDKAELESVVALLEEDKAKISDREYRDIFFRVLNELNDWQRIVECASSDERRDPQLALLVSHAFERLGRTQDASDTIVGYTPHHSSDFSTVTKLIYRITKGDTREARVLLSKNPRLLTMVKRVVRSGELMEGADAKYRAWLGKLSKLL